MEDAKSVSKSVSLPDALWDLVDSHAQEIGGDRSSYVRGLVTTDLQAAGKIGDNLIGANGILAAQLSADPEAAEMVKAALRRIAAKVGQREQVA